LSQPQAASSSATAPEHKELALAADHPGVDIRPAQPADVDGILQIRNDTIAHSTALWTETLQTREQTVDWLDEHIRDASIVVAEVDGQFAGYAAYGPWRAWEGYRFTVENSVYVVGDRQGLGIGTALMTVLIDSARRAGMHIMIAGIEATNTGSIRLHERFGFEHAGTLREVGIKFGRRLDLTFLRLAL
jgi:phosphinothricin acetyltransferase